MCLLWIQAASLFLTIATASLLSTSAATSSAPAQDITTVAGTTGPDHISIHFQAPCTGCFEDSDDVLDLILEIDSAEEECSATPRLNGLPLVASNYDNDVAGGQVTLQSQTSTAYGSRAVQATWQSTCLEGQASIVSVRLHGTVDSDLHQDNSGFTTSFKQKGQPKVLRLQDKPIDQLSQDLCEKWLTSISHELSITPASSDSQSPVDILLQAEYAKLAELQAEMQVFHDRIHFTLKNIMTLLKQKFTACSSMRCVWDTAVKQASPIGSLITSHFQHHTDLVNGCRQGNTQSPCLTEETDDQHDGLSADDLYDTKSGTTTHMSPTVLPSSSSQPTTRNVLAPSSTTHAQASPTSLTLHNAEPSATTRAGLLHVHPENDQLALQRRLGVAIILMILVVILAGLIIRAIIKFRHPRRRAERAARCEERRTIRLYRKAACKHKWRTFWKNLYTRTKGNDEYEEKREVILECEGLLEDESGLEKQIRTMQGASSLVRDLIRAEEGRARNVRHGSMPPDGFEPAALRAGGGSSASSDIAPSYKSNITPPPSYGEDIEGEIVIVDGFRYAYTASTRDDATESSVVDCSPRLSLETGRSTIKDTPD